MRALAYKIIPTSGVMFLPSHLRVVHVSSEPVVLDRSAWQNLTFGCDNPDPKRVVDICLLLEMSFTQQVLSTDLERLDLLTPELARMCDTNKVPADTLHDHEDGTKWQHRLTDSECAKIHLARAFIMNPEILILNRPFRRFAEGQGERKRLMEAIRSHIRTRGLALDSKSIARRRPRTVFFTAETLSQAEEADIVWTIGEDKKINMRLGQSQEEPKPRASDPAARSSVGASLFWPCSSPANAKTATEVTKGN